MIKAKKRKILLLPGDGIGPEVVAEVKLVEAKVEIESFSAVTDTVSKPEVSQLNVFKIVEVSHLW